MTEGNLSFEKILEEKPALDELCEHIHIGSKWYQFGILLKLDSKKLDDIRRQPDDSTYKTLKMFELWLDTNPYSTRRQVIDTLKKEVIEENTVAHKYEQILKKSSGIEFKSSTTESSIIPPSHTDILPQSLKKSSSTARSDFLVTEASTILHHHIHALSQSSFNPVKVSQLLFSERCINEATLDCMERIKGSTDEKKATLLSAIHIAISSNHKNLKMFATVLSKFEKTKKLADILISEYVQMFPDDQITSGIVQELPQTDHSDRMSYEDHASDILHCQYGTFSQTLRYPVRVAQYLYEEGVITKARFTIVEYTTKSLSTRKALFVLLRAVRHAVHTNYHHLMIFASVLLKFTSNVPCANAILKDYEKAFFEDKSLEVQHVITGVSEDNTLSTTIPGGASVDSSLTSSQNEAVKEVAIPIPQKFKSVLASMRKEYAITFSNIREAINKAPPPLDKLKQFLKDGYSYLKSQIAHSNSIDDVLDVVNDHCTLINISCLEGIVTRFKIKEAETHIQAYKDVVQSFCKETKASLCLNETFNVTNTPSHLQCETAVFVLNWDPKDCTIEDIEDVLSESVEGNVQISVIREGKSIIVTCIFPLNLTTLLITRAQQTLESVKTRGLIQLIIGHCTIYDKHQRDKEVRTIVEENTKELNSRLELEQTIRKKMTMQISSIVRQNEETREMKEKRIEHLTSLVRTKEAIEKNILSVSTERQKELETLQEIIKSLALQVREKDQQIEELKQSLKDLAFIPKVRKPVTDQGLEKIQTQSSQEETSLITETIHHQLNKGFS